ncbi:hypothetical protein R3P38DRAFT_3148851 [Favolaschia claudopus]|uniref:F-box domain-containing protein n=1 Tax=Favolaschia claudopus TaxID=2862362 RepID=A0AAV9Z277_9AGAR
MASALKKKMLSDVNRYFAAEILLAVFDCLFFAPQPWRSFVTIRLTCLAICKRWRHLITTEGQYWTWLQVQPTTRQEYLDLCLSRATLGVRLQIFRWTRPALYGDDSSPFVAKFKELLLRHASNLKTLQLNGGCYEDWVAELTAVADIYLPWLTDMVLTEKTITFSDGGDEPWRLYSQLEIKRGMILYALGSPPWELTDMRTVAVVHGPGDTTSNNSEEASRVTFHLEFGMLEREARTFVLPSVRHLTVACATKPSIQWLSVLDIPSLGSVRVELKESVDLTTMRIVCARMLPVVGKFSLHVGAQRKPDLYDVWRQLQKVTHVNLRGAEVKVAVDLVRLLTEDTTVMPFLKRLIVEGVVDSHLVRLLFAKRGPDMTFISTRGEGGVEWKSMIGGDWLAVRRGRDEWSFEAIGEGYVL